MNSCLLIAGEKSGEEHALSFFADLKHELPETQFFGVGGDELQSCGVELLYHLNDFSSWGYSEVILKIPFYKKAMETILFEVKKRNCKVAILIDFQSFNLKLAGKLKALGVEVLYYVAPQAWAWKEYRVKKLANCVHTLFTIIPFEKKWFKDRGVFRTISIHHPLWETYKNEIISFKRPKDFSKPLKLLLLPGSRKFEVEKLLPIFIETIKTLKKELALEIMIVKSPTIPDELYSAFADEFDIEFSSMELTSALKNADLAFAASGTVTLATALFLVPTIVCYKTSLFNQFIYEALVTYRGPISLANIVHEEMVFPELLQDQVTSFNLLSLVFKWYYNKSTYYQIREKLEKTRDLVQGEKIDVYAYMAQVIKETYDKKFDSAY